MMYKCILWMCTSLPLIVHTNGLVPNIYVGAIFDQVDYDHFNGVFYRGFQENQQLLKNNITLHPRAESLSIQAGVYSNIVSLCSFIEGKDVRAILVVGQEKTIYAVSQVAQPLGIPVVGYTTDTALDRNVQVRQTIMLYSKLLVSHCLHYLCRCGYALQRH